MMAVMKTSSRLRNTRKLSRSQLSVSVEWEIVVLSKGERNIVVLSKYTAKLCPG